MIATHGDPQEPGSSSTFGGDVKLRTSKFRDGQIVEFLGYVQHSHTPGVSGADDAFGLKLRYPNDIWNGELAWSRVGEEFDPALGFVNRPGVDDFHCKGASAGDPRAGRSATRRSGSSPTLVQKPTATSRR